MMSGSSTAAEDYAALMRGDITISDISSNERNADILRDLKDNNPYLAEFWLAGGNAEEDICPTFDVYDTRGLGVLGFVVGRCANVTDLRIQLPGDLSIRAIEPFLLELRNNRSISELRLLNSHIPRDFFQMLTPFLKGNPSLVTLDVCDCDMDVEQHRSLALALREGKSLKGFCLVGSNGDRYDHEEPIIDNIEALKMHSNLESLEFRYLTMGRNACAALSDLFLQSAAGMKVLILNHSDINDSGIEDLMEGLAHCSALTHLSLSYNPSITARGWRAVSALLEDPGSSLQSLSLRGNGINDQIAILFVNALAHNNTLERLYFGADANITPNGWAAFTKALCDTSGVNSTFLSNHTLHTLEGAGRPGRHIPPGSISIYSLLIRNKGDDKRRVAFRKVLWQHYDFDMKPLLEWDLKVLPHVLHWFETAATYALETEARNQKRKLAAIYQFIRGMPELAIDGITGANKKSGKVGEKRPHSAAFEG